MQGLHVLGFRVFGVLRFTVEGWGVGLRDWGLGFRVLTSRGSF